MHSLHSLCTVHSLQAAVCFIMATHFQVQSVYNTYILYHGQIISRHSSFHRNKWKVSLARVTQVRVVSVSITVKKVPWRVWSRGKLIFSSKELTTIIYLQIHIHLFVLRQGCTPGCVFVLNQYLFITFFPALMPFLQYRLCWLSLPIKTIHQQLGRQYLIRYSTYHITSLILRYFLLKVIWKTAYGRL